MDMRHALKVLNLKQGAYLKDAKASFRTLAKQYHPDKLNINNTKCNSHEKMKEINLAFHILKTKLKPKEISRPKQNKPLKTKPVKRTSTFKNLQALFKKVHKKFFKTTKVKTKYRKSQPSEPKPKKQSFVKKNKTFDSVLNKTIKSSINMNFKGPNNKSSDPTKPKQTINLKNSYSKYMELKQKMRSKRKHIHSEGFAPIEKISPISPVKKT